MSNINIKRAIENIRATTTVYTPIVEVIVNAIQAIEETGQSEGKVTVSARRSSQVELGDGLSEITGFDIEDNGIGFNDEHRHSFDTLYTSRRLAQGGKGFGRFLCLKYFEDLQVKSVYQEASQFKSRVFSMGKVREIIVDEKVTASTSQQSGTVVSLYGLKKGPTFDKRLATVARRIVELLLPYFISEDYKCPEIVLCESNGSDPIRLNDFVSNEVSSFIQEIRVEQSNFTKNSANGEEDFKVRVFKFYAPRNLKSRISLVAHMREVSGSTLDKYIPEFENEFYEKDKKGEDESERNYIIKAYVFSPYLDENVSLERGGFEFRMEGDLLQGISQTDIERDAATIAKDAVGFEIALRQQRKKERVQSYVDEEAPWHKNILRDIDLSGVRFNPTDEEIDACLRTEKFKRELAANRGIEKLLSVRDLDDVQADVSEIVRKVSDTSKDELIHYIALRKKILSVLEKSLGRDDVGNYSSEAVVHDIIFPRKHDTEEISFEDHNLWIMDERLNFTDYVCSDIPIDRDKGGRPDLMVFDKRVLFRGDNEASNPITIFEFKKPQRDDFVNPSSKEDPVQQIVRYVNDVLDGKHKTPNGRDMLVAENTPFYGFVVCDLTAKVKTWLEREKDFKPMPDRLGWFQWIGNINLYVEVISWDKLLRDAKMRHKKFFHMLGM